ncbi:CHCH domain containing protein [Rhynchospora pubera]|uniref:CHCH domain containing protein n=1 Tax=Rhynchospora pubera TaxID=906938 RepID=A0AAV8CNK8_9POAL|nr:CHCH domain containing protein [Rhynchospora pubera]
MGDSYTVQISTKLINQLAREDEKRSPIKVRKPKPKTPKSTNQPQNTETQNQTPPAAIFPPLFLPVPPPAPVEALPEVESIRQVLKESEKVLEKLKVEESDMLKELNKRSKELREKEFKLPYQNPIPCMKERSDCLECYKNYANDPLKCADTVKRFADCAWKSRQSASPPSNI